MVANPDNMYIIPDDVTIIAGEWARFEQDNAPNIQSIDAEIKTVKALLLSNGDTVYRCAHPNDKDCTYTAKLVRSVTSHQRKHSPQTALNKTTRELEELQKTKAEQFINRSNGVKAAHARRAEITKTAAELDIESALTRLQIAKNNLTEAQRTYDETLLIFIRVAQRFASNATPSKPTPIPENILAKAEKWDKYIEFQKLINN